MTDEATAKKRTRSPAYPSVGLEEAVAKAKILWRKEAQGRHPIPVGAICKDWEYSSEKNGAFLTTLSALKQYGLLEEVEGPGPRSLKLTTLGKKFSIYPDPATPEHKAALKEAAMAPALYRKLWDTYHWPLPSQESFRSRMLEDGYTEDAVPGIYTRYKATIVLAGLDQSDSDMVTPPGESATMDQKAPLTPKEGDLVQWTSAGVMQFNPPRRVTGLDPSGQWVFVEGSLAGLPIAEMTVVERPAQAAQPPTPPAPNRSATMPAAPVQQSIPPVAPPAPGQKDFPLYLSNNKKAVLYIPASMTQKDFELLKRQIDNHLAVIEATSVGQDPPAQ